MTDLLWGSIEPVIDRLPDNQQKIIRLLYHQRLTRPYVAAVCGISSYQVMIEEVAALRVVIQELGALGKATVADLIGSKQTRRPQKKRAAKR